MTRQFDNNDRWLIVSYYVDPCGYLGLTPVETQDKETTARSSVYTLNQHEANHGRDPRFAYIPNPRYCQAYNGGDYTPDVLGNNYHQQRTADDNQHPNPSEVSPQYGIDTDRCPTCGNLAR